MTSTYSSPQRFQALLYDLCTVENNAPELSGVGQDLAALVYPSGHTVAVIRHDEATPLEAELAKLKALIKDRTHELVLLGGPPEWSQQLKRAIPFFMPVSSVVFHLPDHGSLWRSRGRSVVGERPLDKALEHGIVGPPDVEAWHALAERLEARRADNARELEVFAVGLRAAPPVATYTLMAVIAAMFGLQLLLGRSASESQVLVRLGALVPSRLAQEPLRLVSYSFLHIGWMHFALNCYVLYLLGKFVEGVLGTWRMLTIYWLAVLGGGVLVMLTSKASLTAGASAGIFGLLGAHAVLAYRPRGLLPKAMIPGAQKAALTNLVINIVNSLRATVSLSGHIGGAVVGALLVATPWLTSGMPTLDDAAPDRRTEPMRVPTWVRVTGMLGIGVLVATLGVTLFRARPFSDANVAERVTLPGTKWSVELPAGIALSSSDKADGNVSVFRYGDLGIDSAAYIVIVTDTPELVTAQVEENAATLANPKLRADQIRIQPPERRTVGDFDAILDTYAFSSSSHVQLQRVVGVGHGIAAQVEVLSPRDQPVPALDATKVLQSLRAAR